MTDLHYLVLSALLTWVMLMTSSTLRVHGWTMGGLRMGMGNREDVPEPTPLVARADRAARNMIENLALFTAVLVAGRLAGASAEVLTRGAAIFFWARVVYFGVYLAGVRYVRTVVWAVGLFGVWEIASAVLFR